MASGKNWQCLIGMHRYAIVEDDNPEFLKPKHQVCTRCGKATEIKDKKAPPAVILPSGNDAGGGGGLG